MQVLKQPESKGNHDAQTMPALVNWLGTLLGILGGFVAVYAILLLLLWVYARKHPGVVGLKDALRLVPELLLLLKRIMTDASIGWRARLLVLLLLLYLASPFDLVPDIIPVIGFADDVIIVAWVLRSVIRSAGPQTIQRHWRGSEAGRHIIERLAGLAGPLGTDNERP